jgi:hypothetical protein
MPSAIEQVLTVIQSALVADGMTVTIMRDTDEILQEADVDCVDLNWGGAELSTPTICDEYLWDATVRCSCWGKLKTGETAFAAATRQASEIAAVIHADYTFGAKFTQVTPLAVSNVEDMGNDIGCMTLDLRVQYVTSKGDWNTLVY